MELVRRIVFYGFLLASIAVAIWGYFKLQESKEPDAAVLEHIPANASCVIETNNCTELISKLTRQNLIWNHLLSNPQLLVAQNGITFLDSLISVSPDINAIVSGNPIYWAMCKGNKLTEHLVLFKLKEKDNASLFEDFFAKTFSKETSISSFEAFYFINNKQKWTITCKDGLVYLCSDLSLLQECMDLDKQKSLSTSNSYLELIKENGGQNNLVYINHAETNCLAPDLLMGQSLWNAEVQLNKITLTGYNSLSDKSLFNGLENQEPSNITGYQFLAAHPLAIEAVSLSNPKSYFEKVNLLFNTDIQNRNKSAWQNLSDSALFDINKESYENIDKEIISAVYSAENTLQNMSLIKLKDTHKTAELLKWISDTAQVYNELTVFTLNPQFAELFKFTHRDNKKEFAILFNNMLVMFSNQTMLQQYLQTISNNTYLGKQKDFMDYAEDNLSLACNYLYYENHRLVVSQNHHSLLNLEEITNTDKAITHISLTAKLLRKNVQLRLNTLYQTERTEHEHENVLWTFSADTTLITPPQIFKNHLTQENELCFQDTLNQLYLISSTGNLIWKKQLDDVIKSKIYTVDIFKNGKFQLLFNTSNHLHLIDRNGNEVQGYPVKLPSPITSNITLLDYENKLDYRVFFACADKRIYNYTLYGIKTEGFTPVKTDDVVTLPIQYVRVGPSDYLITSDVGGKIYAFSRKGEGRIDFSNKTIEQLNHLTILGGNNLGNTKLFYLDDKNNLINKVSLTDKKETIKVGDEVNGYKITFILLNDDNQQDMFVYGNGALYAYDVFGVKLFEYFNEQAVFESVNYIQSVDKDVILAYDKVGSKLYELDVNAKLMGSYDNISQAPLVTKLYQNEKNYLVTVNKNKISCKALK